MQLLSPIGLLAAAGILVPLLIHLWKVNQGKTIKIGSVALLGKISSQQSKSRKLSDWLLLALRSLLILLLAFIIAQPYLNSENTPNRVAGWILVEKQQLPVLIQNHRSQLDSLLEKGYELRDFNYGFQKLALRDTALQDIAKGDTSIVESGPETAISTASLLKQLNTIVPAQRVYLFKDRKVKQMGQELPVVNFNLTWIALQSNDTLSSWSTRLPVKSYDAYSSPAATWYSPVNQVNDSVIVFVAGNAYPSDAAYVKAALRAITDFSRIKLVLKPWNSRGFLALKPDLVFWLSDEPIDPLLQKSWKANARLFSYEKGDEQEVLTTVNFKYRNLANVPAIELRKRKATKTIGPAAWTDGYGTPLLTMEKKPDFTHYHFYSRFHPQWTDLVGREQFVKSLLPIVMGSRNDETESSYEDHPADQRLLDKHQQASLKENATVLERKVETRQAIAPLFWLFAWLVFMLERIIFFRKNKTAGK